MTRFDWDKNRKNRLPKEVAFDLTKDARKRRARRKGKPPILVEIACWTKKLKACLEVGSPLEMKSVMNELRKLVLSYVSKTGRTTTEVLNARTVISMVSDKLTRPPVRHGD